MIRNRSNGFALALALVFAASTAWAGGEVTIVSPAEYKDGILVSDAVKAECELPTKVPAFV